jgi:hypothetical protein
MRPEFVVGRRAEHLGRGFLLRPQVASRRRRLLVPGEKHHARQVVADLPKMRET